MKILPASVIAATALKAVCYAVPAQESETADSFRLFRAQAL
jgi:hypothetical protein